MMNVYFIGDIHGDGRKIHNFCERMPKLYRDHDNGDTNVLVCLGDFGANFYFNSRDVEFKEYLGEFPIDTYFVIRGNHEERPSKVAEGNYEWETSTFFGNTTYVERKFPYIQYALDAPAVYDIQGYKTLVVPGAYSIDKYYRLSQGWTWFEGEQLTSDEMEAGRLLCKENNNEFDIILSHTCPTMYEPTDLFLSSVDQTMVDKTMERYLGELEYNCAYKVWMWGHFHQHREYPREIGVPTYENPRQIMLLHDVVELNDVMTNEYNAKKM